MDTAKFATKTDIKKIKSELTTEIKFLKEEVRGSRAEIKELRADMTDKLDKIADTLDGFVGRVDDLTVDNEVGTHQTRELELKVEDLDKRVTQIESPKQVA